MKDRRPILLILLSLLFIFLWTGSPALSAGPSPEERFEQGLSFYKKGEYAQALKIFQQSEEELGEHRRPEAIFMQGQALRALHNWPVAVRAFSRAAETHALLSDYAFFFQAEALQKLGEGERSLEVFQSLATLYPQSLLVPQAQLRMGELYLQLGNYLKTVEIGEGLLKGNVGKDSSA